MGVVQLGAKSGASILSGVQRSRRRLAERHLRCQDASFDFTPLRFVPLRMLFAPKLNYTRKNRAF